MTAADVTGAAARFDGMARSFATSEVHRSSPTIQLLHETLGSLHPIEAVCDIACGAGPVALSFGESASRLVGVDPSPSMLEEFQAAASARGVTVEAVLGFAEEVPLEDETFDVVTSRLAPHHFSDIHGAVREMARLARPGGHVAVIDLEGHDDDAIDDFNHRLEVLHDPTHVRSYRGHEWEALFLKAGLETVAVHRNQRESPVGVSVERWCQIAGSGTGAERQIRSELRSATSEMREALGIEQTGDEYYIPVKTVLVVGQRPA